MVRLLSHASGVGIALILASAEFFAQSAEPPSLSPEQRARAEFSGAQEIIGDKQQGTSYVTFTFDDGPNRETTSAVLDALAHYDIPATFFVVGRRFTGKGERAQANAATLDRALSAGHEIGNHTFAHKNLRKLSTRQMREAIDANAIAIATRIGYRPYLFRPPYGALNRKVRAFLAEREYTVAMWSIDPKDFRVGTPVSLRKRVTRAILQRGGGVVLMHDTKARSAQAIAGILDDLEAENCRRQNAGVSLILPVSIHYFLRERGGSPRPVPSRVAERTERYRASLAERCQRRKEPITVKTGDHVDSSGAPSVSSGK
jgi:peptidoglycan/xylan/chitin deacetylase (PgdA/CDA1 family)